MTKTVTGWAALSGTLMAAMVAVFVMMQAVVPWLGEDPEGPGRVVAAGPEPVVDATRGQAGVAEQVLVAVVEDARRVVAQRGWRASVRSRAGSPGFAVGFGCTPGDGLAPVVAQILDVSRAGVSGAVTVRAYGAGGGAVAFSALVEAVSACSAASVVATSGLGVESVRVSGPAGVMMVWRRGDVVASAAASSGSVDSLGPVAGVVDARLRVELAEVCVDPEAGVVAAVRSPYLNRSAFKGFAPKVTVARPPVRRTLPAEKRPGVVPVQLPGRVLSVPEVGVVPSPPVPAITQGPKRMPAPVAVPVKPDAPGRAPQARVGVPRAIEDGQGPGCGWAFTGLSVPPFDAEAADAAFATDKQAAESAMTRAWLRWQDSKVAFYAAYADYRDQVRAYRAYAGRVEQVRAAWAVVESARGEYYAAMAAYEASVQARQAWMRERRAAAVEYRAAVAACAAPQPSPSPSPTPAPGPSPGPSRGPSPSPGGSPSDEASPGAGSEVEAPKQQCPPQRPAILDEPAPKVLPSPTPAPQAQLD